MRAEMERMGIIDTRGTLEKIMAENSGLPEYKYIMKDVYQMDVSGNEDFERNFNYFTKVRRN